MLSVASSLDANVVLGQGDAGLEGYTGLKCGSVRGHLLAMGVVVDKVGEENLSITMDELV